MEEDIGFLLLLVERCCPEGGWKEGGWRNERKRAMAGYPLIELEQVEEVSEDPRSACSLYESIIELLA